MATVATIRQRIYEYLYSAFVNDRPFETLLGEALDNSETDVDVTDGGDWGPGDIAEVVETGEQMLVLSVATNTLTVTRAYGAISATAAADAGRLRKNPRFSQDQMDSALSDVLNGLEGRGVHGFNVGTITFVAGVMYYEISDTDVDPVHGVIAVYYVNDDTKAPVPLPFTEQFELSTADADWSQGRGVRLLSKGDRSTTASDIYYTYAQSLNFDTNLTTTIAKVLTQQEELLVIGAVSKMIGMTILPMTMDPGQRTDRTTAPGQTVRDGRRFIESYTKLVRIEEARLAVVRGKIAKGSVLGMRVRRFKS